MMTTAQSVPVRYILTGIEPFVVFVAFGYITWRVNEKKVLMKS
jgi:hypothetical protein